MPRPNILWICSDQQRFDTIAGNGNRHINTPNLDRLAQTGTLFDRAYCQAPICTPSRASFLTGMYPSTVHACTNGNEHWDEAAPLLPAMLRDAGYVCGLSGKLHLAGAQGRVEPRPRDDGYSFFSWSHHPQDDWDEGHDYADWVREQGEDPRELYDRLGYFPSDLHQTTWCTNEAMRFIEEAQIDEEAPGRSTGRAASDDHADRPWFMSVNYFDPHAPFDPPEDYRSRYSADAMPGPHYRASDLAAQAMLSGVDFQSDPRPPDEFGARKKQASYYAMIELIDHNVGRLLDFLEQRGLRDNTIVIYTSDHGESLGDHGLILKGCRFYEGLVRVPLIVSWPAGGVAKGQKRNALVELTDIAPTLLEAADDTVPERMVGSSLLRLLCDPDAPDHHRDTVRSEYYNTLNKDAPGRDFTGSYGTMIREERYKLVTYHGHELGELFDLESDPWEHNNLWDDPAHVATRFRLLKTAFDQTALSVDLGPRQTTYF